MLTQEKAHELFEYKDGELFWKINWSDKAKKGKKVGCIKNGYFGLKINTKDYRVHRVIYLMHHGTMPKMIDHKDGNPLNNKIENLRECTNSQNNYNSKIPKTNTSGMKGVRKKRNHWIVEFWINGKPTWFGSYKEKELAELVCIEARKLHHKEFARHV
jgi:hypothetical protein